MKAYLLILLAIVAVAAEGCGNGDETTQAAPRSQAEVVAGGDHPDDASAREEGRRACEGMDPLEAARHYVKAARRAGVRKRFAELVTEPPPKVEASPGYPQLVAALYATTVPGPRRAEAAAGCAEELAAH